MDRSSAASADAPNLSDDAPREPDAPPEGDVLDVVLEESGPPGMSPSPRFEGATEARLVARTCPYCRFPFTEGAGAVVCSECGTPHHADCWRENGGCTTYGCREAPGPRPGARPGDARPGPQVRLSGRTIQLPRLGGKGWIPIRLGRRQADESQRLGLAMVASFVGGFGAVHPWFSPLLLLCAYGIGQGIAILLQIRAASGFDPTDRGGAWATIGVGVFWIVVAAINYYIILR